MTPEMDFSRMSEREILALRKSEKVVPSKGKKGKRKRMEAVKVYRDGREVCQDNAAGRREYKRRIQKMCDMQEGYCRCGRRIEVRPSDVFGIFRATFGHDIPRGLGGGSRDDRIEIDGKPINHAECFDCNMAKGSKRSGE